MGPSQFKPSSWQNSKVLNNTLHELTTTLNSQGTETTHAQSYQLQAKQTVVVTSAW